MKRIWIPVCFALGLIMLTYSLYYWGGLASHPDVGGFVRDNTSKFGFMTWAYSSAGSTILEMISLQGHAADYAAKQVGDVFPVVKTAPFSAMSALYQATPFKIKAANYLGPLLILIAGIAQWRKPKAFKTYR
jgi:hypothetical protein